LKLLKKSAPEVQKALEVMTSSEASSSEARSPEAVVHRELKNLKLQKLEFDLIMPKSCKRRKECNNDP